MLLEQQKQELNQKDRELNRITKEYVKLQREVIKDKVTLKNQSEIAQKK